MPILNTLRALPSPLSREPAGEAGRGEASAASEGAQETRAEPSRIHHPQAGGAMQRRIVTTLAEERKAGGEAPPPSGPERLPQELIIDMLQHLEPGTDRPSILSAALASKTMHAKIRATGRLKTERLIRLAKDPLGGAVEASNVIAQVMAPDKYDTIRLVSVDRLAILLSLRVPLAPGNSGGTSELVAMVEGLDPEHQAQAIVGIEGLIWRSVQAGNIGHFDRLANIAARLPTGQDNRQGGMGLLKLMHHIPLADRLTRFDRLAPLSAAIQNDQDKAEGIEAIAGAICALPEEAMKERFMKYTDMVQTIQDADTKTDAFTALAGCLRRKAELLR